MNKNEIFQYLKMLNNSDIPTMIYRETVFDIISFGKTSKIHLATTASVERVKRVLAKYNPEDYPDEKDTVKLVIENDTFFIHSIFKMSYDEFIKKMVPTNLTFNSLLMKPNGQIYDMYDGLSDLKNKKLNFVNTFNLDADNHLALNCIRYIYKNNFTASEEVIEYLRKTISAFSKSEKTNALFYLVEALNNNSCSENLDILFNSDLFAPVVVEKPMDYKSIIDEIGISQFIYVLLLLLNINVNKSKFSTIIDVAEFNEIKEKYSLDLSDEINYYNLKDEKGYEYLSNIISLQKTICLLTGKEFTDPIYHKQTVFDMLENTNSSIAINGENFLLNEETSTTKVQLDKKNPFELFEETETVSVSDVDFSSIFEEKSVKEDFIDETIISKPTNEISPFVPETDSGNTTDEETNENSLGNGCDTISNTTVEEDINKPIDNYTSCNTENFNNNDNANTLTEQCSLTENTTLDSHSTLNKEDNILTEKKDDSFNDEASDEEDDIDSLLSSFRNNESSSLTTKTRSKNPHMDNIIVGNIANNSSKSPSVVSFEQQAETQNTEKDSPANNDDTFIMQNTDTVETNIKPEENIKKEIIPPEQPKEIAQILEEQKSNQKRYSTSSIVDSIFEEEVKVKPIEMTSDFGSLVSEVADSTKDTILDVRRKTVDENLPEDDTIQKIEEIQKLQNEDVDFNIDDKDLISILDELNGKKNNSGFLDDDDSEQPPKDDIILSSESDNSTHQFFTSKNEKNENENHSQNDNDFFRSLSDDFNEIVGGNN